MNNCSLALFLFLALITGTVIGQVPQGIPYQAIARDVQGQPLASRAVKVRFSVLDSTATGTALYVETHTATTSALGLFAVNVGMGTPVTGTFSGINWGVNSKFLKVELDTTTSGNSYVDLGTQQMMSVPYALYAGNIAKGGTQGQVLTMCDGYPVWTKSGECPAKVLSINCTTTTFSGHLTAGYGAYNVNSSLSYYGGNGGYYSNKSFNSTGVLGLSASIYEGIISDDTGSILMYVHGTPLSDGIASFNIEFGSQTCSINLAVDSIVPPGLSSCGAPDVLNSNLSYDTVTDLDGNVYRTILIGSQTWMAENLSSNHYQNGDLIPLVTNDNSWKTINYGASCWYENDSNSYKCPYGKLYNWYACADTRNICPLGWHVPSDYEWNILITNLDPSANISCSNCVQSSTAAYMMKSNGSTYWYTPYNISSNSSGFSALPGGMCFDKASSMSYVSINYYGYWWTSTAAGSSDAWLRGPGYNSNEIGRAYLGKGNGFSVRCVKN